jgi:hypothetical protein
VNAGTIPVPVRSNGRRIVLAGGIPLASCRKSITRRDGSFRKGRASSFTAGYEAMTAADEEFGEER